MPANAFAAIRPIRRVQRSVARVRVRRSGACPSVGCVSVGRVRGYIVDAHRTRMGE